MKVVESSMNVLQAAKIRIRNVFANGCKIYLSFSSGKDSLCMANLVYEMILSGELDPKQLTVTFIDEEGLYPSMVDAAHRWRRELEADTEQKDYKALCKDLLFLHPERYTIAKDTLSHIEHWRGLFIKTYGIAEQKHYKTMYEGLLYGDPKMRILRILWTTIYNDHNARIKEEQNHGKH